MKVRPRIPAPGKENYVRTPSRDRITRPVTPKPCKPPKPQFLHKSPQPQSPINRALPNDQLYPPSNYRQQQTTCVWEQQNRVAANATPKQTALVAPSPRLQQEQQQPLAPPPPQQSPASKNVYNFNNKKVDQLPTTPNHVPQQHDTSSSNRHRQFSTPSSHHFKQPSTPKYKRTTVPSSPNISQNPLPENQQTAQLQLCPSRSRTPLRNITTPNRQPSNMQEWVKQQRLQRSNSKDRNHDSTTDSTVDLQPSNAFTPKKLFDASEPEDRNIDDYIENYLQDGTSDQLKHPQHQNSYVTNSINAIKSNQELGLRDAGYVHVSHSSEESPRLMRQQDYPQQHQHDSNQQHVERESHKQYVQNEQQQQYVQNEQQHVQHQQHVQPYLQQRPYEVQQKNNFQLDQRLPISSPQSHQHEQQQLHRQVNQQQSHQYQQQQQQHPAHTQQPSLHGNQHQHESRRSKHSISHESIILPPKINIPEASPKKEFQFVQPLAPSYRLSLSRKLPPLPVEKKESGSSSSVPCSPHRHVAAEQPFSISCEELSVVVRDNEAERHSSSSSLRVLSTGEYEGSNLSTSTQQLLNEFTTLGDSNGNDEYNERVLATDESRRACNSGIGGSIRACDSSPCSSGETDVFSIHTPAIFDTVDYTVNGECHSLLLPLMSI